MALRPAALSMLSLALIVSCLAAGAAAAPVDQACVDIDCFSGVIAACGGCFTDTSSPEFCKSPCQPTWGGIDAITCLGQGGNTFWLNNVQGMNVKCGLPPIPAAGAGGGDALGATAGGGDTAGAAAAPAVDPASQVTSVGIAPGGDLSVRGGRTPAPRRTSAAGAAAGAGAATGAGAAAGAGSAGTGVGTIGSDATGAAAGGDPTGTAGLPVDTGGGAVGGSVGRGSVGGSGVTGTGGTAVGTGPAVSSAIAAFSCTMGARFNQSTATECVDAVTTSNQCTQPCASQFGLIAEPCRNAMAADSYYGKTWQGIFRACQVAYNPVGPRAANDPAALAAASGPTVATAATQAGQIAANSSSTTSPLLAEATAPASDQAVISHAAIRAAPLLAAAAAAAALLL